MCACVCLCVCVCMCVCVCVCRRVCVCGSLLEWALLGHFGGLVILLAVRLPCRVTPSGQRLPSTYTQARTQAEAYRHTDTLPHTCSYIHTDIQTTYRHTDIHTHTYIHTYIHTYMHTYMHIYIHTYIQGPMCVTCTTCTLRLTGATEEPGANLKNASRRPWVALPRLFSSFFTEERMRSSL
jgi:hypothetical protein